MAERVAPKPRVYTIPPHRAFSDALAAGLTRRFGSDPLKLARGLVLLPNNRAKRAITDAFVRASGEGLLLPRLVAIGDPELDEAVGAAFDPADDPDPVPPAVAPLQRRLVLARMLATGDRDAAEAMRLAGDLARTLDQLLVENVPPRALRDVDVAGLSDHWQVSLDQLRVILDQWPGELARLGRVDLAERRSRLLERVANRWRIAPPPGFVCAAGVTTSAPAVAALLKTIAYLPAGMVVLPGVATGISDEEWAALGPHKPEPGRIDAPRSIEVHPQFHLKLLLDRMDVARSDVSPWRVGSELDAPPARGRAIATALQPARFTRDWAGLPKGERNLAGVRALEVATSAEEAQAIAIALREALETPGRTAALVTPDRALGARVAAHCRRWGIAIDDSAGQPLATLPPGALLLAIAEAAAQDFAPVALLTLLKHPLVRAGERRVAWLDGARALDLALRGPRPGPGLEGIDLHLANREGRDAQIRAAAAAWWPEARGLLVQLVPIFAAPSPLGQLLAAVRETATALCGDAVWSRPEGRAAAQLIDELEREASNGPALVAPAALAPMLRDLMDEVAVRPPQGGHPRLAIYGLLEARLQTADLMILGSLNEGSWPGIPAPDPWLAPPIRAQLGLPGLERRIGLAAHDFAGALGAREVLLTRARRDASGPTVASRFWLRLEALAGGLESDQRLAALAAWIDRPGVHDPVGRPRPAPPANIRPRRISVTDVDRLKADPYAFYAKKMLRLAALDMVDADPSAAWRGTAVHDVLERWAKEDRDPATLVARAEAAFAAPGIHPVMRALWKPRVLEPIAWIAEAIAGMIAEGRTILDAERDGEIEFAGVTLSGKFDRVDTLPGGGLAIVDYKTGQPPSPKAVRAGYNLQLGLLGLMVERGGFEGISGEARAFEYWSLSRRRGQFGFIDSPCADDGARGKIVTSEFVATAAENFADAVGRWLTGAEAFTAKLVPEYAPYADYDQLMRRDEWWGRD